MAKSTSTSTGGGKPIDRVSTAPARKKTAKKAVKKKAAKTKGGSEKPTGRIKGGPKRGQKSKK